MSIFPDINQISNIIAEVAAQEVIPRFKRLADSDIRRKAAGEIVTVADEVCEKVLSKRLVDALPGAIVVGEEAVATDPGILDLLASDQPIWIVDPIDGTSNFAAGNPEFAIIVALAYKGNIVAGWIYDPCKNEMSSCESTGGAFHDGRRMAVSSAKKLNELHLILSDKYFEGEALERVRRLKSAVASTRPFTCAGLAYVALSSGRAGLAAPGRLRPWDHAAGVLMHREAGGHNALSTDESYTPMVRDGRLIVAPSRSIWLETRDLLEVD
jgi:fructose-1,6-bisphosphatase/inositol monophosphatase family enzyme